MIVVGTWLLGLVTPGVETQLVQSSVETSGRDWVYCDPVLNNEGLCVCLVNTPPAPILCSMVQHQVPPLSVATMSPHVPYLPPQSGQTYPMGRKHTLRLMYVDDVTILEKVSLPTTTVPLLPTFGPNIGMRSCQLGIPGEWLALQHNLRDIDESATAMRMLVNTKKTKVIVFNKTEVLQAVPYISLLEGQPVQCARAQVVRPSFGPTSFLVADGGGHS